MDASFRDWAGLPAHVLDLIVSVIVEFCDFIRFSSVCPQWHSVALEANLYNKVKFEILKESRKKLPMLMFTTDENYESWGVYSVQEEKNYNVKLPIPYKNRFVGSSRGWLFCLDKETMVVNLVNPFSNRCISLPPFRDTYQLFRREWHKKYFDYYIQKAILFSDPGISPCGYVVVVIYGGCKKVAFFKAGDLSWNFIDAENTFNTCDIIYHKGKLYAIGILAQLVEIDIKTKTMKTIIPANDYWRSYCSYLVESQDGELLLVKSFDQQSSDDEEPDNEGEDFSEEEVLDFDIDEYLASDDDIEPSLENKNISASGSEVGPEDRQAMLELTHRNQRMSCYFKVFKMTCSSDREATTNWVELNNIGKQALFVGDNHSVSVSTIEFPKCGDNYIYHTTQYYLSLFPYVYNKKIEDCFVFDLEGKGRYHHHKLDDASKYLQPPIWYVANPEEINLGT